MSGINKKRNPLFSSNTKGKSDQDLDTQIAMERFALIAPLRHPCLSRKKRRQLCREIAKQGWIHPRLGYKSLCERTVWNWYRTYNDKLLNGLKRKVRKDCGELKAFPVEVLNKAVCLKDEVPARKVERCIEIMELRGEIKSGSVKRSTLQRHLQKPGKTGKKIKDKNRAVRRYCAEKPGDVWHSDEKHGPYIYCNGKYVRTNIFGIIDDCSRNCCGIEAFLDGTESNMESMFKDALLIWKTPSVFYCDNGKVYISKQFTRICAELGISLLHTPVYSPESNGKQEKFWDTLKGFIMEANNARYTSISALNNALRAYVDIKYNRVIHSAHKRTPLSVYMEGLKLIHASPPETIELAFRYAANRLVRKDATFKFDGRVFEVDSSLSGQKIELRYTPNDTTDIIVFLGDERVQRARFFNPPAHLPKRKKDVEIPKKKTGRNSSREFLDSLVQKKQRQKQKLISLKKDSHVYNDSFTLANLCSLLDMPEQRLTRRNRQEIAAVFDTFGPFEVSKSKEAITKAIEQKGKNRHLSFYLRVLVESKINNK